MLDGTTRVSRLGKLASQSLENEFVRLRVIHLVSSTLHIIEMGQS
jgi:hypothetical protein